MSDSTTFTVTHQRTRGYLVQINDHDASRVDRRMAEAIVMLSTGGDRVAASEILEDLRNGGASTGVSAVTFTYGDAS